MSSIGPTNREAGIPGLTPSETKLIALGVAFTKQDGKVDYDKVAEYGGYTKGSASVLYRKALKKLMDAYNLSNIKDTLAGGADGDADAGPTTPAKPSKAKARGSTTGKKRKAAADATPGAPGAENPSATANGDAGLDTPTKPKRQRKTPAKKVDAAATAIKQQEAAAPESEVKVNDEEVSSAAVKAEGEDDDATIAA